MKNKLAMASPSTRRGFTLIELMVTVAIIGILASIALPAFQTYILKSKRADAHSAIMKIQLDQEKYRTVNPTYGSDSTSPALVYSTTSPDAYYTISISGVSDSAYTVTATPRGSQTSDTTCATITLTVSSGSASYGPSKTCWNKP